MKLFGQRRRRPAKKVLESAEHAAQLTPSQRKPPAKALRKKPVPLHSQNPPRTPRRRQPLRNTRTNGGATTLPTSFPELKAPSQSISELFTQIRLFQGLAPSLHKNERLRDCLSDLRTHNTLFSEMNEKFLRMIADSPAPQSNRSQEVSSNFKKQLAEILQNIDRLTGEVEEVLVGDDRMRTSGEKAGNVSVSNVREERVDEEMYD
ncbi:uncharacterized protein RCC_00774 [Ramularia collo-cygni]|uniref:Uncharacterized protein n=1 Tax=Ramularia collo-cygni TaxID=112498 RepID=A0A2D3V011_9PEZI|nr:uncharacterized protein RCC_00774 [Ramularia collo-cygni]CZT14829.1 uncharacterized protein RCC_00774 [Ramularia collo-cygni]